MITKRRKKKRDKVCDRPRCDRDESLTMCKCVCVCVSVFVSMCGVCVCVCVMLRVWARSEWRRGNWAVRKRKERKAPKAAQNVKRSAHSKAKSNSRLELHLKATRPSLSLLFTSLSLLSSIILTPASHVEWTEVTLANLFLSPLDASLVALVHITTACSPIASFAELALCSSLSLSLSLSLATSCNLSYFLHGNFLPPLLYRLWLLTVAPFCHDFVFFSSWRNCCCYSSCCRVSFSPSDIFQQQQHEH